MPKRIWFLRHGQSEGNVALKGQIIFDPALTKEGRRQARAARQTIKQHISDLDAIIVSPLRRAIETALLAFDKEIKAGVPLIIAAQGRELMSGADAIGSPPANLAQLFPTVDFSHLPTVWWYNGTDKDDGKDWRASRYRFLVKKFREDKDMIKSRLWQWYTYLGNLQYQNIAVVGHHDTTRMLTKVSLQNCELLETRLNDIPHARLATVTSHYTLADRALWDIVEQWPVAPATTTGDDSSSNEGATEDEDDTVSASSSAASSHDSTEVTDVTSSGNNSPAVKHHEPYSPTVSEASSDTNVADSASPLPTPRRRYSNRQ